MKLLTALSILWIPFVSFSQTNPLPFYLVDTIHISQPLLVSFQTKRGSNYLVIPRDSLHRIEKHSTFQNTAEHFGYIFITPYQLRRALQPYVLNSSNPPPDNEYSSVYASLTEDKLSTKTWRDSETLFDGIETQEILFDKFYFLLVDYKLINSLTAGSIRLEGMENCYVKVLCPIIHDK